MEDSKAAKSRRTSSHHCWRSSEDLLPEEGCSSSAPGASALVLSGGGVAGAFAGGRREMEGFSRRFVMRLKGFSSTLSKRRLWRASVAEESQYEADSAGGREKEPSLAWSRSSKDAAIPLWFLRLDGGWANRFALSWGR